MDFLTIDPDIIAKAAQAAVRPGFVFSWCALLVLYSFVWSTRLTFGSLRIWLDLARANRSLKKLAGAEEFAEAFEAYDQRIKRFKRIRHSWGELTESFVLPGPDAQRKVIQNTREPSYYLNDSNIINPTVNIRLYASIPNHLTAAGILGTFVGLAAGISLAHRGLTQEDITLVQDALSKLLSGASLAFTTSIFGIGLSLLFLFWERVMIRLLHGSLGKWVRNLESRLALVTPESVALLQLAEAKQQTGQLEKFNTELIFSLEQALEERVAGKLSPKLDQIVEALQGLRADRSDTNQDALQQIVEQFKETLSQSAGAEMTAMSSTLSSLNSTLETSVRALGESQGDMRSTLEAVVKTLKESATDSSSTMQQTLGETLRNMNENLTGTTDQMRLTLEEVSRSLRDAVGSSSIAMQEGIRGTLDQLSVKVDASTEEMRATLSAVASELKDSLGSGAATFQGTFRETMEEVAAGLKSASTGLADQLNRSGSDAAAQIAGSLSEFSRGVGELKKTTDVSRELVGSMGEILAKVDRLGSTLETAHRRFAETVEPIRASTEAIESSVREVTKQSEMTRSLVERLGEVSNVMHDSQLRLVKTWQEYQRRFEDIDGALVRVFNQINDGLARYVEQVRVFVEQLDQHTGRSIQSLTSVTSELSETLDQFGDLLERRPKE